MRKRFLSYITMVIVIFVIGVNVVKAEDYNFSTKIYKVDVVDDNFITRFNNGEFQEVKSGGTLNAGDTIAVGVYADVKFSIGTLFDIRLRWDDSILEPVYNEYDKNYAYERQSGFQISISGANFHNKAIIRTEVKGSNALENDNVIYWLFFKIKDNASDASYFTFDFNRVTGFNNQGKNEIEIETAPTIFKVNGNKLISHSLGDVNGNGKIDYGDVVMIIAYYLELIDMTNAEINAADMNGDGKISTNDGVLIINTILENN